ALPVVVHGPVAPLLIVFLPLVHAGHPRRELTILVRRERRDLDRGGGRRRHRGRGRLLGRGRRGETERQRAERAEKLAHACSPKKPSITKSAVTRASSPP